MSELNIDWPPSGRYILAVSGGADSMVLLEVFAAAAAARKYDLTVAHFDHGLRADSHSDAEFVAAAAARLGLPFEAVTAENLASASEASARTARHAWLEDLRARQTAAAILTAHHQDDLLETSLLNLARGTGRLGLAPMQPAGSILRPFLGLTRAELRAHATSRHITWREDPTNADITNPRNLLRHRLLPAAPPGWREKYLGLITELAELNTAIAGDTAPILSSTRSDIHTFTFPREFIKGFTAAELEELILAAARVLKPGIQLDRPLVTAAAHFIRTGLPHKRKPLRQGVVIYLVKDAARLTTKASD